MKSLNYKLVQSYYDPVLIKTNAPSEVLYDILKIYKNNNLKNKDDLFKNVKENTYRYNIIKKASSDIQPVFVESDLNKDRETKYFANPIKNWGPKGRPKVIGYGLNIIKKLLK